MTVKQDWRSRCTRGARTRARLAAAACVVVVAAAAVVVAVGGGGWLVLAVRCPPMHLHVRHTNTHTTHTHTHARANTNPLPPLSSRSTTRCCRTPAVGVHPPTPGLSVCLPVYLSVCRLSVCLSVCQSVFPFQVCCGSGCPTRPCPWLSAKSWRPTGTAPTSTTPTQTRLTGAYYMRACARECLRA